ncbi:MAG: ATP-dependent DNA helicase RecG, partial [Gammaproteobacteria bacterium]|nr:ATP-dependent DNA helicase RecG [Gammaproteobacteria bacterium]
MKAPCSPEQRPVTALRGVGEALAERLRRLGVAQVQDLLFVLPLHYDDRTTLKKVRELSLGERVLVEGEVQLTQVVYRRRRQLESRIWDGSGFLTLRFFHFSGSQEKGLARGTRVRCFGEVRRGPSGFEMIHPEYRWVGRADEQVEDTLTPIYPLTEGLSQGKLRALIAEALRELDTAAVRDWIPAQVSESLDLPPLREALRYVHRPPREAQVEELAAGR